LMRWTGSPALSQVSEHNDVKSRFIF
jgi:hypothetical protein